jgi:hypothetical protein
MVNGEIFNSRAPNFFFVENQGLQNWHESTQQISTDLGQMSHLFCNPRSERAAASVKTLNLTLILCCIKCIVRICYFTTFISQLEFL